jgi:hypothetical protein
MILVGFEPTILAFERAKTVHALDRATTVTARQLLNASFVNILSAVLETVQCILTEGLTHLAQSVGALQCCERS